MTYQEAIEIHIAENIHRIGVMEDFMHSNSDSDDVVCRKNISVLSKINGLLQMVQQYRAIGTVEECRVAVEKQKPKKPIYDKPIGVLECPCCGNYLQKVVDDEGSTDGFIPNHCSNCGQKIDTDWSEAE